MSQFGTITIDEAITRANRIIIVSKLLRIGLLACSGPLYFIDGFQSAASIFASCFCLIGAIIFPFLYGILATVKWRTWAFSRVANPNELMDIAASGGILPRPHSWSNKLLIQTKKEKADWEVIKERIAKPVTLTDDHSLPESLAIYNYKIYRNLILVAVFGLLCFLCLKFNGFPSLTKLAVGKWIAYIALFTPILLAAIAIIKWNNRNTGKPYIVLSNEGIQTIKELYAWRDITDEKIIEHYEVIHVHNGTTAGRRTVISLKHQNKIITLDISSISESKMRIYYLLRAYRSRYTVNATTEKNYRNTAISF